MTGKKGLWITLLIIAILIVLPTGTPEDLVTTVPIIVAIGLPKFILLSILLIIIYQMVKKK